MNISREEEYYVDLSEELEDKSEHRVKFTSVFRFSGRDLLWAIIVSGMPDTYLKSTYVKKRSEQIRFKIYLFETFVTSKEGKLFFDFSQKSYLDSTEIGAINYWIGMILITLLGIKKYNYQFMVHYSMVKYFAVKLDIEKAICISSGKKSTLLPDLIAVDNKNFGVFESKGYSRYSSKAMEHGWEQAKSIETINGKKPTHKLVVMTETGKAEGIKLIEKDPDGGSVTLEVDLDFLYLYHLIPIVELIKEIDDMEKHTKGDIEKKITRGMKSVDFENEGNRFTISIPSRIYDFFLKKVINQEEIGFKRFVKNLSKTKILSELVLSEVKGQNALLRIE